MQNNIRPIFRSQFDDAKFYFNIANASGFFVLLIDILANWLTSNTIIFVITSSLIAIIGVFCSLKSSRSKDIAEALLRRYELQQGLGWNIDVKEIVDILASSSKAVKNAAKTLEANTYFSDQGAPDLRKLLANLSESAFFTKHQSRRLCLYLTVLSILFALSAIISLIITIQNVVFGNLGLSISKSILSIIVFLFTAGYVRLAFDYNSLFQEANRVDEIASSLAEKTSISQNEAITLLLDYQVSRATGPLIPSWLWKLMSKELNDLWKLRADNSNQLKNP